MLIFKTKGIILKIHKVGEKDFLYTIFTNDYGKLICQKKISAKEKTLDIGYIINCEIETKEDRSIHKMRNIRISSELNLANKSFSLLNNYLELLALVLKNTPGGSPIIGILPIFELLHSHNDLDENKLLLGKLKILHIFGTLPDFHQDSTIQKILKFIHTNKIDRILKLTGINPEVQEKLKKI